MSGFFKHTIIIYENNNQPCYDIEYLAMEAVRGGSICDSHTTELVGVDELPDGVRSFLVLEDADDD